MRKYNREVIKSRLCGFIALTIMCCGLSAAMISCGGASANLPIAGTWLGTFTDSATNKHLTIMIMIMKIRDSEDYKIEYSITELLADSMAENEYYARASSIKREGAKLTIISKNPLPGIKLCNMVMKLDITGKGLKGTWTVENQAGQAQANGMLEVKRIGPPPDL